MTRIAHQSEEVLLFLDESKTRLCGSRTRFSDHVLVWLRASRLDRELAAGVSPDTNKELALRARMLVRPVARRRLAHSLDRLATAAIHSSTKRRVHVPLCLDRIEEAAADFQTLIDCLVLPGPVSVRGIAQLRMLLGDGRGPIYHPGSTDDLASRIRQVTEALEPLAL